MSIKFQRMACTAALLALAGCGETIRTQPAATPTPTTTTANRPLTPAPAEKVTSTHTVTTDKVTHDKTPGALDQSEKESDLKITQTIRHALTEDKSMSTAAHNITIVAIDGVVTLKGAVKTEAEKTAIAERAKNTADVKRVDDLLQVKP